MLNDTRTVGVRISVMLSTAELPLSEVSSSSGAPTGATGAILSRLCPWAFEMVDRSAAVSMAFVAAVTVAEGMSVIEPPAPSLNSVSRTDPSVRSSAVPVPLPIELSRFVTRVLATWVLVKDPLGSDAASIMTEANCAALRWTITELASLDASGS